MKRRVMMAAAIRSTVQAMAIEVAAQEQELCRFVCAPSIEVADGHDQHSLLYATPGRTA
jgi:hypothetical protein